MSEKDYPNSCDECKNKPILMEKLKRIVSIIRPISVSFICIILSVGIVGFFVASLIINSATMDMLNGFVSIILGLVALTTSIVSMFLSFYSIERAEESDKELNKMLQEMKNIQSNTEKIVSKIEEKQDKINENMVLSMQNSTTKDVEQNDNWKGTT